MDEQRARELIGAERHRVEGLIGDAAEDARSDRDAANSQTRRSDEPAERLVAEGGDDAVVAGLRDRLAALDRAEERLAAGTYGRSVRSGRPIPDDRLEADPAAELTVDEAAQAE